MPAGEDSAGYYGDDLGQQPRTQGHPEQDRALSLRGGAFLQTFPHNYEFLPPEKHDYSMRDVARHICNAVPVRLGEIIGESISGHIKNVR